MEKKQALVIGLGQFGMAMARTLDEVGVEVIAVDIEAGPVHQAASFAEQAVQIDATDEEALATLAPERRDLCICGIGGDSRDAAILVTALLRQLGAKYVVARASDRLLERILGMVGAHEVVNPERAFGQRFARRLVQADLVDEVPLGRDLVISELRPRPSMVGRSLRELSLPKRFGITVLALREGADEVLLPDPDRPLRAQDTLVVVAQPGSMKRLDEAW